MLGQPVSGTVLHDNTVLDRRQRRPVPLGARRGRTTVEGNTALGAPVALCEGQPPPRQVFVMVIAVAVANPDGSKPTATPDLTVPTLGVLPLRPRLTAAPRPHRPGAGSAVDARTIVTDGRGRPTG